LAHRAKPLLRFFFLANSPALLTSRLSFFLGASHQTAL